MSIRRIGVLLKKEFGKSASNFFFVWAIVIPLVLTLLVTLVFGDLFSQTPRLGLYAEAPSELVTILAAQSRHPDHHLRFGRCPACQRPEGHGRAWNRSSGWL